MSVRNLEYLYQPQSIAVVGATDSPGIGAIVTRQVLETFKGKIHLVNPSGRRIFRMRSVKTIAALPEAPHAAIVITPADALESAVEELGARGVKGAVIITDPRRGRTPAAELRRRLFQAARRHGLRINGPNSLGLAVPRLGLHATMSRLQAQAGRVAFLGQSATAAGPLVDWATPRAIGFSCFISLGDMVDVDYADVLYYLSADPRTRCIVLFAERLPGARKFMSAARHAARAKPVIIMKTGERQADAHGPETPSRDDIYEAAFRRAGLIRVRTLEDLFHAVEALAVRLPADTAPARGDRLAVMANGESICALAVDALAEREGRLAALSPETVSALGELLPPGRPRRNPVDLLPDAGGERYAAALEILGRDRGVDTVLAASGPTGMAGSAETAQAVADAVARMRKSPGRRAPWVITSWPGGEEAAAARRIFVDNHIPHFDTPSMAVAAFSVFVRHRAVTRTLMETPASISAAFEADAEAARRACAPVLEAGGGPLPPSATAEVLSAYGMSVSGKDAPQAADPPPVFGLHLSLDPEFGPVFRFGLAGQVGHLLDEGVAALPPLNTALAKDVVRADRAGAALFRERTENGEPAAALGALTLVLSQVSQLVVDVREICGLTLHIAVTRDSALIRDAALEVSRSAALGARRELAIRPYPKELESRVTGRDGAVYTLRPIRPEDEPPLQDLFERLSPDDVRMRFFRPLKALDHEFAARLTQIDYDRHMALVLTGPGHPGEAPIHGVVRLVRDPDEDSAEFAVTVESALQGTGLGRMLMERIIEYGRSIGLKTIFGLVLAENRAMLRLTARLGFSAREERGEPGVLR
ncbi:MAG: GNAT family N-acetyltransferase, partial [Alphaproteobacteria bacterium]